MECNENYIPDFNFIDYALCCFPIDYYDRCFYFPQSINDYIYDRIDLQGKRQFGAHFLDSKEYFANFIAGHESESGSRGAFFKYLSENYKRVESVGRYLNNQNTGKTVQWKVDKIEFQRKCKFSLCFESTCLYGFNTEKITDAFYAGTIPIYLGDPNIKSIFNEKAFINCADYDTWDDVLERIKQIDQNDALYLKMINENVFVEPNYLLQTQQRLDTYIRHIFNADYDSAYRRSRVYWPKGFEFHVNSMEKLWNSKVVSIARKIVRR